MLEDHQGVGLEPGLSGPAPDVGVVIATRDRPELLKRAVDSINTQSYSGRIRTIIVFDGADPDVSFEVDEPLREVRVVRNGRTPGLSGARNTGILALGTDLVAFLDDDDVWHPEKLDRQVAALVAEPAAVMASTAMAVRFGDEVTPRLAGRSRVAHPDLLASRMAMLHSSSFLFRRGRLVDLGLISEEIPGSMCEDWDILLRSSAVADIVHVDRPLVEVLWGTTSFFSRRWETKIAAHEWMLEHHPDIATSATGVARLYGQLAFENAALRRRRRSLGWAWRSWRANPREMRGPIAVAVCAGLSPAWVLSVLHRRGRGL